MAKNHCRYRYLITFVLSDEAAQEESPLIGEVKRIGAATMVVCNRAIPELRRKSDLLIVLGLAEPEFVRLAITTIPAQLLGLTVGLCKGLNPDLPRNLTRAVVLAANGEFAHRRAP